MKKICALLIICSIGFCSIGCDKKKDATGGGGTGTASTGTGSSSTGTK